MERLSSNTPNQTRIILRPCLQAACGILSSFDRLRTAKLITFTRTHMHLIFIANLVVIAITHGHFPDDPQDAGASPVDLEHWLLDLDDGSPTGARHDFADVLLKARNAIHWLANGMSDVTVYARIIETLEQDLAKASLVGIPNHHSDNLGLYGEHEASSAPRNQEYAGNSDIQPNHGRFGMDHGGEEPFPPSNFSLNMGYPPQSSLESMQGIMWSLPGLLGMEGVDLDMSNFVWDMPCPWQDSQSML
ncbi:hypothetical protein N0V84_004049 [Fusarium piperis]|uniref:Uncharacterized protein n=1 Tax=Fusarium piperis TaxID=1435070 RepID=A0A9W8WGP5_9HYPO|nr:hypothetical protein N0V84_004049 [Fusarium piperis]